MKKAVATALFLVIASSAARAQITVSGSVTAVDTGAPLPGVSILIHGTTRGTTTDGSGAYSIELESWGDVLDFSHVGFRSRHLGVAQGTVTLDLALEVDVLGLSEVVVVGSRRLPRLVKDSAVPVDVLGPADLAASYSYDIDETLRARIPSYNVSRHTIDAEATFVRPTTLRGMPADNVIVLVNGKRRHRSASVAQHGSSLNRGAQGVDLNMIPLIALKQVELLRDGASAQYGADAVAGVFNFQLRDAAEGVHVRVQSGQYFEGDGEYIKAAANVGLPLTHHGFLNLSLEYDNAAPTVRSAQRADAKLLKTLRYPVDDPAQIWGNPDVDHGLVGFFNAGLELGRAARAYAFGGFGRRDSEGGFYYRVPGTGTARSSVFRFGSGDEATRAVADLDESDDIACRTLPDLPGLDAKYSDVDKFVKKYSGQCYLFNADFPGGFTPRFGAEVRDLSVTAGIDGTIGMLRWDASASLARSRIAYFINNTVNASLGPKSPTEFRPRTYIQEDASATLGMAYPLETGFLASPLNLAWGVEWRSEAFETLAGDPDSYVTGPYAAQGFSVGSNGFQGLTPQSSGRWSRPNYAFYLDLEADVTHALLVGIAARYENFYEQFGSAINGKLAALYRLGERASLRGTVSTGLRAPSPGQANLQFVGTAFSGDGNLIEVGLLPSTNPLAAALGGTELVEETASSWTLGAVLELGDDVYLTVDWFDTAIRDRIALTGNIPITSEIVDIIEGGDSRLSDFSSLAEIRFFSNDFDTRHRGVDVLLAWQGTWDDGNETDLSVAWNWTQITLLSYSDPTQISSILGSPLSNPITLSLLTPRRQIELESVNPEHRAVLTARHTFGELHGSFRLNWYDGWQACRFKNSGCPDELLDSYDGALLVGGEVGYTYENGLRFAVGLHNALNSVPAAAEAETDGQGNAHPESTPWDYNGAAWYVRLSADLFR